MKFRLLLLLIPILLACAPNNLVRTGLDPALDRAIAACTDGSFVVQQMQEGNTVTLTISEAAKSVPKNGSVVASCATEDMAKAFGYAKAKKKLWANEASEVTLVLPDGSRSDIDRYP